MVCKRLVNRRWAGRAQARNLGACVFCDAMCLGWEKGLGRAGKAGKLQMKYNFDRCCDVIWISSISRVVLCLGGLLGLGSIALAADPTPTPKVNGPIFYQSMCSQCHGAKGEGSELMKAPSIAGRPAWYVERQLGNFRIGRRGIKKEDTQGSLMAAIAKVLHPAEMQAVAEVVSKFAFVPPTQSVALKEPNIEEGRYLFMDRCAQCHRFNGMGEMTFGSPPLVGLQDWYLLAQINKFKTGWRGVDPTDPNGAKMQLSSGYIESEQAKHDVVAFILSLNPQKENTASGGESEQLFSTAQGQGAAR